MKKMLFAAFAILIGVITIQAQHVCGTSIKDQYEIRERLFANRANAALQESAAQRDAEYYLPIQVHIVGRTDGSQYVSESEILDFLCVINNNYTDQDIQFYFKLPFNYIDNDALYTNAQSNGGELQIDANKVSNAINIFITGNFPQTGLQGYYQPPALPSADFIVIKKSALIDNTASHELGHFFSLAHPFFGWEPPSNPELYPGYDENVPGSEYAGWNEQYFGNPVGNFAPSYGFSGSVRNELADQSNCMIAADGICDTPPDYLFAYSPLQTGCNDWNGGAMDPAGTLVDPMENNMMSYFTGCSNFTFTPDQKAAIVTDILSNARGYIRSSYVPELTEITETPVLVAPANGVTAEGYNSVKFDWDPVNGAQRYFLEIDRFNNFSFNPQRYVLEGTSLVVEDLDPNRTYYWRVRPFAEYVTCGTPFSEIRTVLTNNNIVSTGEIEAVNDWTVRPNPVSSNETLNVAIDAAQSFEAEINLYSITGQLVKTISNRNFGVGLTSVELDINGLTAGLYMVAVTSDEGVINQKVVITK